MLALPAVLLAQSPQEFARSLALRIDGKDALYEVELPEAAYEGALRSDLGDLRVFSGAGEVVPHAFRARVTETTEKRRAAAVNLPIFPLYGDATKGVEGTDFRFEKRGDRIVVEMKSRGGEAAPERRLIGYVVDGSATDQPFRAISFALPAGAAEVLARVRIEASDDLAQWSHVQDAQLARLEAGGQRLEQLRCEFAARRAKYLRVSWPGQKQPFELAGVAVEPGEAAVTVEAQRQWKQVPGAAAGGKPGEYEFDLGGQFPIDRLRFALPQQNTVPQVEVFVRARPADPWRAVGGSIVFVRSTDFLISTIADTLNFPLYGRGEPHAQLMNFLADKKLLLVMDNFEHLLPGATLLTEILQRAPQVKILVTSRERLNLQEEWVLDLQGLPFPDDRGDGEIENYSAVQLFLQRPQQARVSWEVHHGVARCPA